MNSVSDIAKTDSGRRCQPTDGESIASWPRNGGSEILVYLRTFKSGAVRLDFRTYFHPKDSTGAQLPLTGTKRGVMISRDEFEDLASMIDEIRRQFDEAIANSPKKPRPQVFRPRTIVELD